VLLTIKDPHFGSFKAPNMWQPGYPRYFRRPVALRPRLSLWFAFFFCFL
jgi:hypothetical protein